MRSGLFELADTEGVILRRDVLAAGGDDRDIARALRAGSLVRVRNGAYANRELWEGYDVNTRYLIRVRVTYEASRVDVAISHVSAALLLGAPIWGVALDDIHLTRLDGKAGRREARVCQHRGSLDEHEVMIRGGMRVTSPTRTALDMTTVVDMEQSLPVLDHFLHRRQTSKTALRDGAEAMRYWANTLSTDMVISFADGRRESIGESRTAYLLRGSGRPMPRPQYKIRDMFGNVIARADFAWPELGVFLEFDGKVKYLKYRRAGEDVVDAVLREKKREEMICRLTGWRCIRLVWSDLAFPEQTRRYVVSVLDGGPVHV